MNNKTSNANCYKAVVFDMDGLLLDSESLELRAFVLATEHFGLGDLRKVFERCVGTNSETRDQVLKEGLEGLADYHDFRKVWEGEYATITESTDITLKEGVEDFLRFIQARDLPMAVATSSSTERAISKLSLSGIVDIFDLIVGGDQVSKGKPDPEIYLKVASDLNLRPGDCLALEDSTNGVRAAVRAGMTVVQIPDLVQPDPELLELGHMVLGSLCEVPRVVFRS